MMMMIRPFWLILLLVSTTCGNRATTVVAFTSWSCPTGKSPTGQSKGSQFTSNTLFVSHSPQDHSPYDDEDGKCNGVATANSSRRHFLWSVVVTTNIWSLSSHPNVAVGSLLDDFGGNDPSKIVQPKRQVQEYVIAQKGENAIDPTLRASYYFPTARKRYLPRIQKVSDQLKQIPSDFRMDDLQSLYLAADNAILPMKLYTSSLDGQGLRMTKNEFVKSMKADIDQYEHQVQALQLALASNDRNRAQTAVNQLSQALADFRTAGRLTDDIEALPSVDEIRRMTMRKPTMKFAQY